MRSSAADFDPRSCPRLEQLGSRSVLNSLRAARPHGRSSHRPTERETTALFSAQVLNERVNINHHRRSIEMVVGHSIRPRCSPSWNLICVMFKDHLRQDPDVIMVGEIRDSETAKHAIRAALTGHLVVSTLHAMTPRVRSPAFKSSVSSLSLSRRP